MRWLVALFVLALATPVCAEVISAAPEKVAVVVYPTAGGRVLGADLDLSSQGASDRLRTGLAMIVERRTVDLPAGPVKVVFKGVAEGIVPQTATVLGLASVIAEQNFDYRLLSPGSLMRAAEGGTIRLVRTDPKTGRRMESVARVVSAGNGFVLDVGGQFEALNCSELPEKLVFENLPGGLIDKPTLSLQTVVPRAGRYDLTLSYLTTGVGWRTNYVAHIAPDGRTLDLSAWVTIANRSATAFPDAPMQVLAGRLEIDQDETVAQPVDVERVHDACWFINDGRRARRPVAGVPSDAVGSGFVDVEGMDNVESIVVTAQRLVVGGMAAQDLGDYKLYSLPEPTSLAAYQTKQLQLFSRQGVKFERFYRFETGTRYFDVGGGEPLESGRIALRVKNEKGAGLGLPLPAGAIAVFEPAAGRPMLIGEAPVSNTAIGLPAEFAVGEAVNVTANIAVKAERDDDETWWRDVEVTFYNAEGGPVQVKFVDSDLAAGSRILKESYRRRIDNGVNGWTLTVPANGQRVLRYRIAYTDD